MLLNKLKSKSVKRRIKQLLQDKTVIADKEKAKSILFIVDLDTFVDDLKDLEVIAKALDINRNQIYIIPFSNNKKTIKDFEGTLFSYNMLGWKGVIKSEKIKELINLPVDLLINIYKKDKLALNLLSAAAKAKFRVGFSGVDHKYNDLIIDCDITDLSTFQTELAKYLKILNKI